LDNSSRASGLIVDTDAARIGDLYRRGKSCMVDSVRYLLEAGSALIAKQDAMAHGQWIPWLKENAQTLGFASRYTAAKLMSAARKHSKCVVDGTFAEEQALQINRETWGNTYSDTQILAEAKPIRAKQIEAKRTAKKAKYNARISAAKPRPLEGTYRIIYADPPWKYHGLNKNVGHTEDHYDCLDDDALCDYRPGDGTRTVRELADDNAVLFLWVLERCFKIVRAWGFEYKASFVWDKARHVMGHYNSVRHENLLICTRGSCTPDTGKLIESVQRIKRSDRHSEKPREFYDIIEPCMTMAVSSNCSHAAPRRKVGTRMATSPAKREQRRRRKLRDAQRSDARAH
jgi:N6-adenosine-specific RNA methylase IME4